MYETTFLGNKNVTGKKIMYFRKKLKLSQDQVAARLQVMNVNMNQQLISRIERNERMVTDYELVCFCRALHVTLDEMMSDFYEEYPE